MNRFDILLRNFGLPIICFAVFWINNFYSTTGIDRRGEGQADGGPQAGRRGDGRQDL
jgi:hypothetical protein